jgi:cytochrome P450
MTAPTLAPGPRGLPFFGQIFEAWKNPLELVHRSHVAYGDHVALRFGPARYLLVNDPDSVKHVLVDNHRNYQKSVSYDGLKLVLGSGLLTSEGNFWRRQRKLAQPAFHKEKLALFAEMMVSDTNSMLDEWQRTDDGAPFDVHDEIMRLTFSIVCRTLFSTDTKEQAEDVGRATLIAMRYAREYTGGLYRMPTWLPTPKNVRFKKASRTLDELVLGIINGRRESNVEANDLLSMLMSARDEETREQMTDRQLRDEVMTLALAGHETTANTLTWTLHLLSQHQDVFSRVRAEADQVLGACDPGLAQLGQLSLTRRVIEESMRLYPPAWIFERQAIKDDELGGFRVPKDTVVAVSPYTLHRHPRFWPEPERFDPDRFLAERIQERPKHAYLPFGAGPRVCIGNAFAMMEAQIILAMIARRYELTAAPDFSVEAEPSVTLRPREGVFMTRRARPAQLESHAAE